MYNILFYSLYNYEILKNAFSGLYLYVFLHVVLQGQKLF